MKLHLLKKNEDETETFLNQNTSPQNKLHLISKPVRLASRMLFSILMRTQYGPNSTKQTRAIIRSNCQAPRHEPGHLKGILTTFSTARNHPSILSPKIYIPLNSQATIVRYRPSHINNGPNPSTQF